MVKQKEMMNALLAALAVYAVWGVSFGSFLFVVLAGAIVQMMTKSLPAALLLATVVAFSQNPKFALMFMDSRTAAARANLMALEAEAAAGGAEAVEGFQARDPKSIAERIEMSRAGAPLRPKIASPTGVLESPSILDNVPLKPLQELTSDAQPGASIPASAKARVLIYPVPESFVPAPQASEDRAPMVNPYLQNGPDNLGVAAALIPKGTDIPIEVAANDIQGASNEAAAF